MGAIGLMGVASFRNLYQDVFN